MNKLERNAIIAEVKRNPRKIDRDALFLKVATLKKPLMEYTVEMRGPSMENM